MGRSLKWALLLSCALLALLLGVSGCGGREDRLKFVPAPGKYDVRILRDTWGVPHVFGKRDADVAYGLAYAHCEDDWRNIEDNILIARAQLASVRGKDWAKFDYLMQLFRIREAVDAKYETDLSEPTRAVIEAYADGVNHYAALHRDKMPDIPLPVTGKDIVAAGALKAPFFYDLEGVLKRVFKDEGGASVGKRGLEVTLLPTTNPFAPEGRIGSNAWAVGPKRSADGCTRLAVNSHMPWEGPVTFYEAHAHSEEGWNMVGGTFPGGPLIFLGHDENKGWCHTINRPDLADVYKLELNPDNPDQYRFDGEWRDFEKGVARMKVRLLGPISWTFKRELLWSVHGPSVRQKDGVYAVRFAGYGQIAQLEQWYRMNKARNLEEFQAAMRLHKLHSLNTVYADKKGNLFYAYNGQFPVRAEGYDWKGVLPGDTSKTLWTDFYPFDRVPQVVNPPSGFIQSCNSSPFQTTDGPGNPRPEDFPATMGIETQMTNRALRAIETYGADPSITRDEFFAYKYDKTYSQKSWMADFLNKLFAATLPEDPLVREGVDLLKGWNRTATKDNTGAALAVLAAEWFGERGPDEVTIGNPVEQVRKAANVLKEKHGRLDVPWEQVMRLRRSSTNLGLGGAPDCLRAVDIALDKDGTCHGVNGDCYILMVEWDKDGRVSSQSIHQYGSATLDPKSPHYADQAPLFAEEKLKPVWLAEADIRAHLEREYRPGDAP